MKILVFLTFFASLVSVHAEELSREVFNDGSSITIIAPLGVLPSGGYAPIRVEIENKGSKDFTWGLKSVTEAYSDHYFRNRGESKISAEFGLNCPAGESRNVELLVPVQQRREGGINNRSITITGSSPAYPDRQVFASMSGEISEDSYCLTLSDDLPQNIRNNIQAELLSRFGKHRSSGSTASTGVFEINKLPQDWSAYAGLDALFLTLGDSKKLSPGVSNALSQWVLGGGRVVVLNSGDETVPDSARKSGFGSWEVRDVGTDFANVVLGTILGEDTITKAVSRDYSSQSWEIGQALGKRSMHSGLLILALLIFAILVGPINLFIWANKHRRHRLFVTTPLISLGASVILVIIIIFQDGFGGDGARAVAIDVGEPGSTSAAIVQEQFSRTGILFSSGFTLDEHSVMVPVPPPESDFNRTDSKSFTGEFSYSAETIDDGWKISGEWFSSRSEQAQIIRSVIPSRERLELLAGTGNPRLASTFSYPLSDVFYADASGEVFFASSIAPGETVTLKPSSSFDRQESLNPVFTRFARTRQSNLKRLISRPNSFAATATGAPAIATLKSIDWQESPALITGLLSK